MRGLCKEQTEAQMSNLKQLLFLDVHSNKKAKFLSGGNKRKLCCAMALISKPDLIFMDEFQNGVDPMSRKNLYTYLKTLKDTATLIVTHYIDEAEKICDKIANSSITLE
jgi:ABC-type multidrug transport system ATPase subunit